MKLSCKWIALLAPGFFLAPAFAVTVDDAVRVDGGAFQSVVPLDEDNSAVAVDAFRLDRTPVTNEEFLAFVVGNPEWRRGDVVALFADSNYLAHWQDAVTVTKEQANQPVVNVSWFAARAYCEAQGGRLPTWHEWEYVAAADPTERDARDNPAWRQKILGWYSQAGGGTLPDVGRKPPNAWGVQDMHGLVWEWVEDFNAMLVSSDSREQGGADQLKFCGAGAATLEEKQNYAILMRTAMLSSLDGNSTTRNTGFRCAYTPAGEQP
ncbi:MAG TPA: formylglycine-generating enzyme family protein [Gammaproteobacteria bacterium]